VEFFSIFTFLSNFDHSYLGKKCTYLAQTWLFTQGISTTDVVKSLFIFIKKNIYICIYETQIYHVIWSQHNVSI